MLASIPLLGVLELALHFYFAERAPDFADYQRLAPLLLQLKQPGMPVVVVPAWAEPLVRQAAPAAFPIPELARPDDASFSHFLEVSLLSGEAESLRGFALEQVKQVGPFRLSVRKNPKPEPTRFDFVAAVERGEAQLRVENADGVRACSWRSHGRTATGGLHGHVAYPAARYECGGGRFVGVSLIDDEQYRPRRCILLQLPDDGRVILRFQGVPASQRLRGFAGFSYFLERDVTSPQAELELSEAGQTLGSFQRAGAQGWAAFETARGRSGDVEVALRRLRRGATDFCFALEAR